jgi:microcystin-dependent protein
MAVLAPISGMPQFRNGKLVAGAVAYFYDAGTTTDRTVYEAAGGGEHTQPVEVTGSGNFPAIYIQGSSAYKIRVEDGDGGLIIEYDDLQGEVTASSGGGGGGEGTTIPTGFEMPAYTTGVVDGWVRENGRTIGSATSGATERANADTEDLFLHLWDADNNLAVSGGRGGSAASDWTANKAIALPSARGRVLVGLDDMGNSAAGALAGGTFTFGDAITLGSYGGAPTHTLLTAEMPSHTHPYLDRYNADDQGATSGGVQLADNDVTDSSRTTTATGGGGAHNNMQPFTLRTIYIKL